MGRYTHRVAISNNRLLTVEDGRVTLDWNDYRDNHRQKKMTLSAEEFITFRKEKLYRNISNKRFLEQSRIVTQSGIPLHTRQLFSKQELPPWVRRGRCARQATPRSDCNWAQTGPVGSNSESIPAVA